MNKWYAGIGSRETPVEIQALQTRIADRLEDLGYGLRSGGAQGSDKAFEKGVKNKENKRIYRPHHATKESISLASEFHPNWNAVLSKGDYVIGLMGRNPFQVLGPELHIPEEFSKFLICWALPKDTKVTVGNSVSLDNTLDTQGGTGLAYRIAIAYGIKCYNLYFTEHRDKLQQWLDK